MNWKLGAGAVAMFLLACPAQPDTSCKTSSDCYDDEYCEQSTKQCKVLPTTGGGGGTGGSSGGGAGGSSGGGAGGGTGGSTGGGTGGASGGGVGGGSGGGTGASNWDEMNWDVHNWE